MTLKPCDKPLYEVKLLLDKAIAGCNKEKLSLYCLLGTHKMLKRTDRAHAIIVGESSAGKSWMLKHVSLAYDPVPVDAVKKLLSKPNKNTNKELQKLYTKHTTIELTGITKEVLKRWEYPYDNHIVVLPELDGATAASSFMRVLMSDGEALTLVSEKSGEGKYYPTLYAASGIPVVAATTASDELEHQLANRCTLVYLHPLDNKEFDELYALMGKCQGEPDYYDAAIAPLRKLGEEVKKQPLVPCVSIPYHAKIAKFWPKDVISQTRMLNDCCKLIKGIARFHQRATAIGDDWEIFTRIFCSQKHKLPAPSLHFLHKFQGLTKSKYQASDGSEVEGVTFDDVVEQCGVGKDRAYRLLEAFGDKGLIAQRRRHDKDQYGRAIRLPSVYYLTDYGKAGFQLPDFKTLMGDEYEPSMFHAPYDPITGQDLSIPTREVKS